MAVKSAAEVALIRESCKWGNLAHRLLFRYTRVGANEVEVSRRAGTEATLAMVDALGPLYRSGSMWHDGATAGYRGQIGRNASIPHSLTTNATFMAGDVLVTGANAPMWGYNSEVERTMVIGEASADQKRFFAHMLAVQEIALEALKPGVTCSAVDRAVRAVFRATGSDAVLAAPFGTRDRAALSRGPVSSIRRTTPSSSRGWCLRSSRGCTCPIWVVSGIPTRP